MLLSKWQPCPGFKWPYAMKNQGGNQYKRSLKRSHIDQFPDFAYSEMAGGLFCKFCVLAETKEATYRTDAGLGKLVTKPLCRYDRLTGPTGDLNKHLNTEYHKRSAVRCHEFLKNQEKGTNVYKLINSQHKKTCEENRKCLKPIVETVIFCGQNNIPLRGNDDSGKIDLTKQEVGEGNFRRLLRYRAVQCGDTNLEEQLKSAPRNACYTSGDIQNQIIECVGAELRQTVVSRVKKAGFYVIMADETTDITATEQLSLCLRYYDHDLKKVCEDFICFLDVLDKEYHSNTNPEIVINQETIPTTMTDFLQRCEEENQSAFEIQEPKLTGKVIGKAIVTELEKCGLSPHAAVAQSYDGASVMSSTSVGTCSYVKEHCKYAEYYHCSAHVLNLVLVHASKRPVVRNMIGTVKKTTSFLSTSNKKKITLRCALNLSSTHHESKNLQSLCETRWVERVTALENFVSNYVPIVRTLMAISRWQDPDAKSEASSLIKAVTNSTFIVTLFCVVAVTNNIDILSERLQEKGTSLNEAMKHIQDVITVLEEDRKNSDHRFARITKWILDTVLCLRIKVECPRVTKRSVYRDNPDISNVDDSNHGLDYFRVAVYIPFLDTVLEQLRFRFNEKTTFAGLFDTLLPGNCVKNGAMEEDFMQLWRNHSQFLIDNNVLARDTNGMNAVAQYRLWVTKWKRELLTTDNPPTDHIATLSFCDANVFPSIYALLTIASILPISTATVERSFSSLRLLKTYLRNRTTEDRLNGLAMMYIYATETIDVDRVIGRFANMKNRRLLVL